MLADLLHQWTVIYSRHGNLLSKCHTHPHQHSHAHNRRGSHPATLGFDSGCAHRGGAGDIRSRGVFPMARLHNVLGEQEQARAEQELLLKYKYSTSEGVGEVREGEVRGM